jgi:hypothetical protein
MPRDALRFGDVLVLRDIEAALQVEDRSSHDRGVRAVAARPPVDDSSSHFRCFSHSSGLAIGCKTRL